MNKNLIAIPALAIAIQGCATQQAPQGTPDAFNDGLAKTCTASPVDLSASATATATIAMTNDGWCAVTAVERDRQAFQLGLVKTRPEHGHVVIQRVNNVTRIEYYPENRYGGADRFTVALRSRTANAPDATVQVSVTTTMGEGMAPPPAPRPTPAPAPTRRPPARTTR